MLADFTEVGQRVVLLEGGMGGRGNASYKTSTNRAPRQHQPGIPGAGDVRSGCGSSCWPMPAWSGCPMPASRPSSTRSRTPRPRSATIAFTTLRPQLGVVRHRDREFVLADIPGLIEGAAEGAGIGDRFLGHIERCRVLIHLVDITGTDPAEAMQVVEGELDAYGADLDDKPRLIALNKIDLADRRAGRGLRRRAEGGGRRPGVPDLRRDRRRASTRCSTR